MNAEKTAKRFMQRVSQSCTGMNPQREFELLNQLINIIEAAQQKFAPDEATATVKCISCDNDIPRPICQSCL